MFIIYFYGPCSLVPWLCEKYPEAIYIYYMVYITWCIYIYITWYILHVKYPEGIYIYTYILYYIYISMTVFFSHWSFCFPMGFLMDTAREPWSSREPREPMDLMDRGDFRQRCRTQRFWFLGGNNIMIILWIIIGLLKFINKNWIIIFIALLLD